MIEGQQSFWYGFLNRTEFIPAEWMASNKSKCYNYFPSILTLFAQRMFCTVECGKESKRLICLWFMTSHNNLSPNLFMLWDGKSPPILM